MAVDQELVLFGAVADRRGDDSGEFLDRRPPGLAVRRGEVALLEAFADELPRPAVGPRGSQHVVGSAHEPGERRQEHERGDRREGRPGHAAGSTGEGEARP
jgi:hypothetical protein